MPFVLIYLLKLSLSLAAVYLFYQLVLRRLTFYNWNRWYLLGYTILALFIPFINITPVLERNAWAESDVVKWVPMIETQTLVQKAEIITHTTSATMSTWNIIGIILFVGMLLMFVRLLIQLISFRRLVRKAQYLSGDKMKVYQVDEKIIPFSFGNSIFINRHLHSDAELQEIIRHEFVHVKQQHTHDIIWGELLCLFNWYNPFAWLIRRAIRQNLEFIADNKVLENGIDRKQYQYLLLKVIGNDHFSIAQKFNFSSLKKRIAMMNKIKTTRVHVIRFLFILPLLFVLLVAFRGQYLDSKRKPVIKTVALVVDGVTREPLAGVRVTNENTGQQAITDASGYYTMEFPAGKPIHIHMNYHKAGYRSLQTAPFSLEKINNTASFSLLEVVEIRRGLPNEKCEGCGGSVRVRDGIQPRLGYDDVIMYEAYLKSFWRNSLVRDTVPKVTTPNKKGYIVNIEGWGGTCVVVVQDKKGNEVKSIEFTKWNENARHYEDLYGEIPAVPIQPVQPGVINNLAVTLAEPANPIQPLNTISKVFEITDKKAVMQLPGGVTETYDLTNPSEKKKFEAKFGKIVSIGSASGLVASPSVSPKTMNLPNATIALNPLNGLAVPVIGIGNGAGVGEGIGIGNGVSVIGSASAHTVIAPMNPGIAGNVTIIDNEANIINSEDDILFTITKNTTRQQLEEFKKLMKVKDLELSFDEIEYNDKGQLTTISGSIKSKDGHINFVANDFNKVILAMGHIGDKTYFKVNTRDSREVI